MWGWGRRSEESQEQDEGRKEASQCDALMPFKWKDNYKGHKDILPH